MNWPRVIRAIAAGLDGEAKQGERCRLCGRNEGLRRYRARDGLMALCLPHATLWAEWEPGTPHPPAPAPRDPWPASVGGAPRGTGRFELCSVCREGTFAVYGGLALCLDCAVKSA